MHDFSYLCSDHQQVVAIYVTSIHLSTHFDTYTLLPLLVGSDCNLFTLHCVYLDMLHTYNFIVILLGKKFKVLLPSHLGISDLAK